MIHLLLSIYPMSDDNDNDNDDNDDNDDEMNYQTYFVIKSKIIASALKSIPPFASC